MKKNEIDVHGFQSSVRPTVNATLTNIKSRSDVIYLLVYQNKLKSMNFLKHNIYASNMWTVSK